MIDIKFLRENPDIVKENIRRKFQDEKLALVDEVIALDAESRRAKQEGDDLRAARKRISKEIGTLMKQGKTEEAESKKAEVNAGAAKLEELEKLEGELQEKVNKIMMVIPNIIDPSVPVGRDDTENVEIEKFGEPAVPDFEVPYHADILDSICGLDKDAAGRTSGNGFYYLLGDAARIHSAMISYARDFMIDKGFTYCIPPFMIRSSVVNGVMSFAEMEAMMYKIEGEDLYLIGTSEHSMIGRFKGQIISEASLPVTTPLFHLLHQEAPDLALGYQIQHGADLVCQKKAGPLSQSPGNAEPLHFTPGDLSGIPVQPVRFNSQPFYDPRLNAVPFRQHLPHFQPGIDRLLRVLPNHLHRAVSSERRQGASVQKHFPVIRLLVAGQDFTERGLSEATGRNQAYPLLPGHFQMKIF